MQTNNEGECRGEITRHGLTLIPQSTVVQVHRCVFEVVKTWSNISLMVSYRMCGWQLCSQKTQTKQDHNPRNLPTLYPPDPRSAPKPLTQTCPKPNTPQNPDPKTPDPPTPLTLVVMFQIAQWQQAR